MTQYPDIRLHLGGIWWGDSARHVPVINPATGQSIGQVPVAGDAQLQQAADLAQQGFALWRATGAHDRAAILRKTAQLLRDRAGSVAYALTLEQGRPLADTQMECMIGAEVLDWFAEEAKRTYGRLIPARQPGVSQLAEKHPIGPVLAISTWNVPINHAARKVGAALAAGCSVVLKGPEEAPASTMLVVQAFLDAGLPAPVLSLVFGDPAQISETLIAHPAIRKLTFTGSTPVGKLLAAQAGAAMKPATLELGGHAPVLIFDDADIDKAVAILSATKFRNAGQICISPTRFLVQDGVFDRFTERFVTAAEAIKTGNGLDPDSQMGPLSTQRRVEAIEAMVQDAMTKGAHLRTGGTRLGNEGFFYAPTVLTDVPIAAAAMNDEPFGPVALINRFSTYDQAITEANRLDYGLAAYAYTGSAHTANRLAADLESGMVSINHHGLGPVEAPFGGIKGSGMGSEGGPEAVEAFLVTKYVSRVA